MRFETKVFVTLCCLATASPAISCNRDRLELPYEFDWADTVIVGRVSHYRVLANEAEGDRLKRAIDEGAAPDWQRKTYDERLAKGLPIGGIFGLFDVAVTEVLKGNAGRQITVIYPNVSFCCVGPGDHSMLPTSLSNEYAIMGLGAADARTKAYYGLNFPVLVVDPCTSAMLVRTNPKFNNESRKYLRKARPK